MRTRSDVIPVVCTLDEEPNLERCLTSLRWARAVVVLDSGSTDRTEAIARGYPNVHWHVRPFDTFAGQWTHALALARPLGPLGLALDADMCTTEAWVAELEERFLRSDCVGALLAFEFRMGPQKLWGSLRRAEPRLFQLDRVRMEQEGHALRYVVTGPLLRFRSALRTEDRKSLSRWARNQLHYAALDAQHLHAGSARGLKAFLRRAGWMPLLAFLAAYVRAGGPLRGAAAKAYAAERAGYESLLSLQLSRLRSGVDPAIPSQAQSREVSPR
jgi:Glycosyl transferase family 2